MALLTLPESEQNLGIARRINNYPNVNHVFAVAQYPEEVAALKTAGVETSWNLYAEAGNGFAEEVIASLGNTID